MNLLIRLRALIVSAHQDAGYYVACEGKPLWQGRLLAYRDTIRWLIGGVVCHFKGHDMVDDSTAGPDSGSMAGHCERCGYSFHTTLY